MATFRLGIDLERVARRHIRPISFLATAFLATLITIIAGLFLGYALVAQSDYIFQGVTVDGEPVGNRTRARVINGLAETWQQQAVVFSAEDLQASVSPVDMGVIVDSTYVANTAYAEGRNFSPWWLAPLRAILLEVDITPRYVVDFGIAEAYLNELAEEFAVDPVQPQIVITDGVAMAQVGEAGQVLDVDATLELWQNDWFEIVQRGELAVVTTPVDPAAYAMERYVGQVNEILASPLIIQGYDPIANESYSLPVSIEDWVSWLQFSVVDDALFTDADANAIAQFLEVQNAQLDGRYYSVRDAETVRRAISNGSDGIGLRLFYPQRVHEVVFGETLSSIGANYGIPYPYLVEINPEVNPVELRPGTEIVVPSPDSMLPLPIVRNKRIKVDLSDQRMVAYENGAEKWVWNVSTGVAGSPTSPGIFQVQTHEQDAFNNNLGMNMPSFMGIYRPVPGLDFFNGFHGFPIDEDGKPIWTDIIGKPGTFGSIILPDAQAALLYDWADQGIIVEVVR